jgi:poly(3-hydroxyalkanoate) synthetase
MDAIRPLIDYKKNRGMTIFHDMIDWIGAFHLSMLVMKGLRIFILQKVFSMLKEIKRLA